MNDRAYEKRFSEHPILWVISGAAVIFMHIFIYARIAAAAGGKMISLAWLIWSILMMLVLYVSRRTERISSDEGRKWTDRVGGVWMFFVLITFLSFLLIDLIQYFTSFKLSGASELSAAFVMGLAVTGMGIKQANTVQKTMIRWWIR